MRETAVPRTCRLVQLCEFDETPIAPLPVGDCGLRVMSDVEATVPEIVPVAGRVGVIRRKGFTENKSC